MTAPATASNGTAEQLLTARLAAARKLSGAAIRKAAKIESDLAVNRSTRQRNALKVKANALDEIHRLLSGKT